MQNAPKQTKSLKLNNCIGKHKVEMSVEREATIIVMQYTI